MSSTPNQTTHKYGNWIPLFLLVLPTVMALIPIFVEISPRKAVYFTPTIPLVFYVLVIASALASGALKTLVGIPIQPLPASIAGIFLLIVAYSTIFVAVDPFYSLLKVLDLLLFIGLCYSSAYLFGLHGPLLARNTLLAIFGSVLLAIPLVTVLFVLKFPEYFYWPNFIPGFVYVRIFGFSLAVSIAVGTGLLVLSSLQKPVTKLGIFAGLAVLWTALFWTSSRGGIIALILVTPVFAILIPNFRRALGIAFLAMVVGAVISSQIGVQNKDFGFVNAYNDTFNATSANGFSANRLYEWGIILDFIAERPLFGHGYGQALLVVSDAGVSHAHVHNIVLEFALAWGWIGAACAGFFVIWLWLRGLMKTRAGDQAERVPAFFVVSVLLVYAWVDGVYFYYHALIPMGICIGIIFAVPRCPKPEDQKDYGGSNATS